MYAESRCLKTSEEETNKHVMKQMSGRLKRFDYANHVITIRELIDTTYEDLSCKTCSPQHCLYHLMIEHRTCDYLRGMRARVHDFKLPDVSTILHKKSFLVSALYMHM